MTQPTPASQLSQPNAKLKIKKKSHFKCHVLELYLFISNVNNSFFRVNFTL